MMIIAIGVVGIISFGLGAVVCAIAGLQLWFALVPYMLACVAVILRAAR